MKHEFPIGVFDSGLGGLTIVKALQTLLPHESLIYFGDTAHLPYGDKSPKLIRQFSLEISGFLLAQPVKAIVIACNTASAAARNEVQQLAGSIPVFDVIQPAVQKALSVSKNQRIGIIGTKTTIHSHSYQKLIRQQTETAFITEKATPLLVPMIEEGWLHNAVSQDVIDAYMSDTGFRDIDTLILGCTHYPLIKTQIEQYFKKNYDHSIQVIDSSEAVAAHVKAQLHAKKMLHHSSNPGSYRFLLSDYNQNFAESAQVFLNHKAQFEQISTIDTQPTPYKASAHS